MKYNVLFLIISLFTLKSWGQTILPIQKETDFVYENNAGEVCYKGLEVAQPLIHQVAFARKQGKWGILNKNCELIVDFEYDEVSYLSAKGVKLRKGDYFYVLDIENEKLLSDRFKDVDLLKGSEDTLVACNEEKQYGLVTCTGKQVIPFSYINPPTQIYSDVLVFHKRKGKGVGTGAVSLSGEKKIPFKYFAINQYQKNYYKCLRFDGLHDFYNEKAELFFSEGKDTLRLVTDTYLVYKNATGMEVVNLQSKEKLAVTTVSRYRTALYGTAEEENKTYVWLEEGNYFSVKGNWKVSGVHEGIILLRTEEGESMLYNANGEALLDNRFAGILKWTKKWAVVREERADQELSLVDLSTGKKVLNRSFSKIELLNGGTVKVYDEKGEATLYNQYLKTITATFNPAASNVVYIIPEEKLRMLNQHFTRLNNGKSIFEIREENPLTENEKLSMVELVRVELIKDAYGRTALSNRLVATIRDEDNNIRRLNGIIDFSGRVVVPFEYASIGYMQNGCLVVSKYVKKNGVEQQLFGVMDTDGNLILPIEKERISYVYEHVAITQVHGLFTLINLNTGAPTAGNYNRIRYHEETQVFSLYKFGKYGMANERGKEVIPPIYDKIEFYKTEGGYFKAERDQKTYFVDQNGNEYLQE